MGWCLIGFRLHPHIFLSEYSSLLENKDAANTFNTSAHKFTTFPIFTYNPAIKR